MRTRVLVTGVGGRSVGAGILHALMRTDREVRSRWEVLAVDAEQFSWGLYVADHRELVPPASSPDYLERLLELVDRYQVGAILPGTEAETSLLANHRDELPVPVIANDARLMPLMMDKAQTEQRLRAEGLAFIPSHPWEQRDRAIGEFGFPLFVKPTVGTGGSRGVHLIATPAELDAVAASITPDSRSIVQPYLGDGESEYTVGVLSDQRGEIIDSIVIRRKLHGLSLHESRQIDGKTATISTGISQGFIVENPSVRDFCEALARRLGSCGPLNIQLRMHDDRPYVFEIHPRFSGTTPIRASAGFNEPDVLLRERLHGERFGRLGYQTDVAAIRAFEHVLVPISQM